MKPPGKIRKAPDFARLLKTRLAQIALTYRGQTWMMKRCGHCGESFWKNTRDKTLRANPIRRNYCSKPCQLESYRRLRNARQLRWRRRQGIFPRGRRARLGREKN